MACVVTRWDLIGRVKLQEVLHQGRPRERQVNRPHPELRSHASNLFQGRATTTPHVQQSVLNAHELNQVFSLSHESTQTTSISFEPQELLIVPKEIHQSRKNVKAKT